MPLEKITTEMDVNLDQKNPGKPKKLIASMKKVKTMDTELRRNVPVSQVKKEDQDFVNAMVYAKKKDLEEIKNKKPSLFNKPTIRTKAGTLEPTSKLLKTGSR